MGGTIRGKTGGGEIDRAVVVNETVAVAAFFPSSITEDGATVHKAATGAPVQLQDTAPLK
jgi:hypothetical protein